MVTVCAWCERYLGTTDAELVVSHGICQPCASSQRWPVAPVIVVARDRAEMLPVLEHLLRGKPAMRIVIDRRVGNRRRNRVEPNSVWEHRRGPDRRRRPPDALII
jgi:hypothetical protein